MEWLYVRIQSNSLGDYMSEYEQIMHFGIRAICPDTFLVGVQFTFAQVAQLRWTNWRIDVSSRILKVYQQLLCSLKIVMLYSL